MSINYFLPLKKSGILLLNPVLVVGLLVMPFIKMELMNEISLLIIMDVSIIIELLFLAWNAVLVVIPMLCCPLLSFRILLIVFNSW